MVVSLLCLSIADGVLTLELLEFDCVEANPVMACLLDRGYFWFLIGKYALTAVGLPLLVVCENSRMFGTRFRVGFLIPTFIAAYLVLIFYQNSLFGAVRLAAEIRREPAAGSVRSILPVGVKSVGATPCE